MIGEPANDEPVTAPATLVELLRTRAGDDTTGVVVDERVWTWREVVAASEARARALLALRALRPDGPFHVGVLLENTPDYLVTLFGTALAGGVLVGVNPTRRGGELARDIRHTDCGLVITEAFHLPLLEGLDLGGARVVVARDLALDPAPDLGAAERDPLPEPAPSDLLLLIFTSGSTGAPKAVRMTHGRAARAAAGSVWFTSDDVLYCAMPLFHGNALNAIVLPALSTGATIALRNRFSASQFVPDLKRYRATFFSTVGRALAYVLATPPRDDDREHAVKYALAPESSPADMKAFTKRFGIPLVAGYGSSENAIIMIPKPGIPKDALGVPQEGIDAAVVDPDTGEERPRARFGDDGRLLNAADAIGEIVGRNVVDRFEGYYENPEADAARTRNGWYWSGDLGYRDDNDVFYFAGRTGEWMRVDAENFATAPVERILGRFPDVSGVAVYPVPDERTADDQVMATIEMSPGTQFDPSAFGAFLAAQPDLGTKWAPRYVRVGTLPVGATNKVDKRPLRAERWYTDDPIYWRPSRDEPYRAFTADDRARLEARFVDFGRADAITRP